MKELGILIIPAAIVLAIITFFVEPEGSFDCKWEAFKDGFTQNDGYTCRN